MVMVTRARAMGPNTGSSALWPNDLSLVLETSSLWASSEKRRTSNVTFSRRRGNEFFAARLRFLVRYSAVATAAAAPTANFSRRHTHAISFSHYEFRPNPSLYSGDSSLSLPHIFFTFLILHNLSHTRFPNTLMPC